MSGAETLVTVVSHFALGGSLREITPLGAGLINDTWLVTADQDRGVLQKINVSIFPRPQWNMANLRRVLEHIASKPGQRISLPGIIPTLSGSDWFEHQGQYWRMLEYIDGITLKRVETTQMARSLGWSLGCLHGLLADLEPSGFHDTLPGFHVTTGYLREFDRAVAGWQGYIDSDLSSALSGIEFFRVRASVLEQAELPTRIVHGDPKLDNVLFDVSGTHPVAWVDLDTLKPGGVLYDIGDCVRAACGNGGRFDPDKAIALLSGWYGESRRFLTEMEIDLVPQSLWLLPFELGLRFLTDYLLGNRYFKVRDPRQNLRRALEQLALAREVDLQLNRLSQLWGSISAAPGR